MHTFHHYIFFSVDRAFRKLLEEERAPCKDAFLTTLKATPQTMPIFSYATLGLKQKTELMLWIQSASPEEMQKLLSRLLHTRLGQHLEITHTLFGIARPSTYVSRPTTQEQAVGGRARERYLVVYPFTKTKEWYFLDLEERKKLMHEHMSVGHTYTGVRQHLLHAFGVDDHEFIVSYETASLEDFQSLVMELRSTKVRAYTANDMPIFTCVHKPLDHALDLI